MEIVPVCEIPLAFSISMPLKEIWDLCEKMHEICNKEDGIGLAATQLGIPWHLFIEKTTGVYRNFIDCSYKPVVESKKVISTEGCLSLRNSRGECVSYMVQRWDMIEIEGFEITRLEKIYFKFMVKGIRAVVMQHEIDHGFGILISDIGVTSED